MDVIKRFMFADDSVLVTVISAKDLVNKAVKAHDLSATATAALGRTLMVGAFMSNSFKDKNQRLSITVNGGGGLGKIVVAGDFGGVVKGYVEHPHFELPTKNGKLDVGGAVGKDGYITVIKDLGLKEPYSGRCALVNGEIATDFAYYFTVSEQQPSAVALGVMVDKTGCTAAGGVFIQPLPGCADHVITMLEDIATNFTHVSELFLNFTPDEIIERYFGQFDLHRLPDGKPKWACKCSRKRLEKVVLSLGKEEATDIVNTEGKIEICCNFCGKKYVFTKDDVETLFLNK